MQSYISGCSVGGGRAGNSGHSTCKIQCESLTWSPLAREEYHPKEIKCESIMEFTNPYYMYNIGQQQYKREYTLEHMVSTCTYNGSPC